MGWFLYDSVLHHEKDNMLEKTLTIGKRKANIKSKLCGETTHFYLKVVEKNKLSRGHGKWCHEPPISNLKKVK